jgi:hypothetical protein
MKKAEELKKTILKTIIQAIGINITVKHIPITNKNILTNILFLKLVSVISDILTVDLQVSQAIKIKLFVLLIIRNILK